MANADTPEKLPPVLRDYFCADYWSDVSQDILDGALRSAELVLQNPAKFPKADFNVLEAVANALHARVHINRFHDAINGR
mgnify:FL=1